MNKKVAVIGQGYVGLPLSIAIAEAGYFTIGIDNDLEKVRLLNQGKTVVDGIRNESIKKLIIKKQFKATNNYEDAKNADIFVICVPTPLTKQRKPDLKFIEQAAESISRYVRKGSLVILESTVAPGTTRNFFIPKILEATGLSNLDLDFAFSPERVDPLNKDFNLNNTPKIVAGLTKKSAAKAKKFYLNFIDRVETCKTLEIAETAKLLENSYRFINISFINELSMYCEKIGVDINDVIRAAGTKPYGFMKFYPSLGVGGHCIPVDPIYLAESARENGIPIKMIELSADINSQVLLHTIMRAQKILGNLKSKRILVVGISYKPNISDIREAPAEKLIAALRRKGVITEWHDEIVEEWNGEKSVKLGSQYDLAIIVTRHDYLNLSLLGNIPILDTRGSTN